ncbi:MAG: hypothetical protein E7566_07935 [Ruminococcaceae bacterium]|nr:hypothetical protein [Oscillospiraceae bacterium]
MNKRSKTVISFFLCLLMLLPVFTVANAQQAPVASEEEPERYIYQSTEYLFEVIDNKEVTILFYIGTDTNVTTPEKLGGHPVTKIDNWAFYGTNVEKVTVSENVTHIGDEAFANCKKLTAVTLPSSLVEAGSAVFKNSSSLRTVSFRYSDHPVTLGEKFLFNCTSLINITLPNRLSTIPDSMLKYCESLKTITLPEGIESIKDYAFYDSGLNYIELPATLQYIGSYAFANTNSLYAITANGEKCEVDITAFNGCPAGNPFKEKIPITTEHQPIITTIPKSTSETPSTPTSTDITPTFSTETNTNTPPLDEYITVYFANNKNWYNVFIYGDYSSTEEYNEKPLGEYPGTKMTFVEQNGYGFDIYKAEIPADIDYIKFSDGGPENNRTDIIPNAEFGNNTGFYLVDKGSKYWSYGTFEYSSAPPTPSTSNITANSSSDEPSITTDIQTPPGPSPIGTVTVYFINNMDFLNTMVYFWGSKTDIEWPGIEMRFVDTNYDEEDIYCAEIPADASGITFNGISSGDPYIILQTHDITDFRDNQIFKCGDFIDGKFEVETSYGNSEPSTTTTIPIPPGPPEPIGIIGDANSDCEVNIIDALDIKRFILGLSVESFDKDLADADCNGNVNVKDATAIQKYLAGIPTGYPIGESSDSEGNPSSDIYREVINIDESTEYKEGDTITYSVTLRSDEIIGALQAKILYDPDKLELVRVTSDDPDIQNREFEGNKFCPNLEGVILNADEKGKISFNAVKTAGYDFKKEMNLIKLQFTILDSSCSEINIEIEHIVNKNGNPVDKEVSCGINNFIVDLFDYYSKTAIPLPGDINGDGNVNIKDPTLLQKHLAGLETLTSEQEKYTDIDTDGKVTVKDATMIQKFVAGLIDSLTYKSR